MNTTKETKAFCNLRLFLGGACAATLISIILRTVNLFCFYDSEIGYYASGAVLPIIANIFMIVALVSFAMCSFLFARNADICDGKDKNLAVTVVSVLCALVFVGLAVLTVMSVLSFNTILSFKSILFLAAAILSAVYFLMNTVKKDLEVRSVLSIAIIVVLVFFLAASYFDVFTQMNSPNKVMLHIACISAMIFFLNEARCVLGTQKNVLYTFFLTSATLLTGSSSVPSIIAYHTGILENYNYIIFDYTLAAIWIYLTTRLVLCFFEDKKESPLCGDIVNDDAFESTEITEDTVTTDDTESSDNDTSSDEETTAETNE